MVPIKASIEQPQVPWPELEAAVHALTAVSKFSSIQQHPDLGQLLGRVAVPSAAEEHPLLTR